MCNRRTEKFNIYIPGSPKSKWTTVGNKRAVANHRAASPQICCHTTYSSLWDSVSKSNVIYVECYFRIQKLEKYYRLEALLKSDRTASCRHAIRILPIDCITFCKETCSKSENPDSKIIIKCRIDNLRERTQLRETKPAAFIKYVAPTSTSFRPRCC